MKTCFALVVFLGAALLAAGQPASPPKAPPAGKAPAGKEGAKKEEPPAKIEGMEISRGAKGFLGLAVVEGKFKLSFYDAKKKPATADFPRAALRWEPKGTIGIERTLLTPGSDGKFLTSAKVVRPPYMFRLYITLQKDGVDGAEGESESLVVDFRQ